MTTTLTHAWDDASAALTAIPLAGERVRYAAAIKPLLALDKSASILEAGCGAGRLLRALAALGYANLTGLEISPARLQTVRQRGPASAKLVCSDQVPLPDACFDGVVTAAVIEHVVDPKRWLGELARVTRPGGVVSVVTDTYMWRWLQRLGVYQSIQPLDRAIRPGTLIGWARDAGLRLEASGGFVNEDSQRWYFLRQLLRRFGCPYRLRAWLDRKVAPQEAQIAPASGETGGIVDAVHDFEPGRGAGRLGCLFSYECYYRFRKA